LEKYGFTREVGQEDQQAIQVLMLWKQLWERLEQVYDQLKVQRRALDFDDLEMLTEKLLAEEPPSERLQAYLAGINHLMVDEFQDTNQIQQSIIYKLAHPEQGDRLFVVGDAKQSIYRFRQAQVSVFNQTKVDVRKPAATLRCGWRVHFALTNLCSHSAMHCSSSCCSRWAVTTPISKPNQVHWSQSGMIPLSTEARCACRVNAHPR
jgi:ATP-dependent exoDNAse (exonuclease V) beta subunit